MRTLGILPASGIASRMGGLPKFLLPIGPEARPLIELHLEALAGLVDEVVVAVHPKFSGFLYERVDRFGALLTVLETRTMNETVLKVVQRMPCERYVIGLPDVYLADYSGYAVALGLLDTFACSLAVWQSQPSQIGRLGNLSFAADGTVLDIQDKIAGCPYDHHWGIAGFHQECLRAYTDRGQAHIGFAAEKALRAGVKVGASVIPGRYYDCGTPQEYVHGLEHSLGGGLRE